MTADDLMRLANRGAAAWQAVHLLGHLQQCLDALGEHGVSREELSPAIVEVLGLQSQDSDLRIRLAQAEHRAPHCGCISQEVVDMVHRGAREVAVRTLAKDKKMRITRAAEVLERVFPR